MSWWVLALISALLWGFNYASYGAKLSNIAASTMLFWYYCFMAAFFAAVTLVRSGSFLIPLVPQQGWWFAVNALSGAGAVFLTTLSIQKKNATYTSLIEIAYPVFVALFTWLMFGQQPVTWRLVFGGLLILSGVAVIVTK